MSEEIFRRRVRSGRSAEGHDRNHDDSDRKKAGCAGDLAAAAGGDGARIDPTEVRLQDVAGENEAVHCPSPWVWVGPVNPRTDRKAYFRQRLGTFLTRSGSPLKRCRHPGES